MQKGDTLKKMPNKLSKIINKKLERLLTNTGDMALKRRARRIIEELNPRDGDRILDVGCGDGYYLHLLSSLGLKLKLTGVDFDPNALQSARRNLKGKRIHLVYADLMKKLPFPDNCFDKIVMSEVCEHLPDDVKGLKEVHRILKPGGKLLLTVPCHSYPFLWDPVNWVLEHLFNTHIKSGFWAGIWNQHIRLYSLSQINSVLKLAGFVIEQSEAQTFWCVPFNHNILNLGARLLVGSRLSDSIKDSASKFSENPNRNINFVTPFFAVVNLIDKLNNISPVKSSGVSIFVKAKKEV